MCRCRWGANLLKDVNFTVSRVSLLRHSSPRGTPLPPTPYPLPRTPRHSPTDTSRCPSRRSACPSGCGRRATRARSTSIPERARSRSPPETSSTTPRPSSWGRTRTWRTQSSARRWSGTRSPDTTAPSWPTARRAAARRTRCSARRGAWSRPGCGSGDRNRAVRVNRATRRETGGCFRAPCSS